MKTISEIKAIARNMGIEDCFLRGHKSLMIKRIKSLWETLIGLEAIQYGGTPMTPDHQASDVRIAGYRQQITQFEQAIQ